MNISDKLEEVNRNIDRLTDKLIHINKELDNLFGYKELLMKKETMNCPKCQHQYKNKDGAFCSLETNHNMGLLWRKEYKRTPKWCYFKNSKHSTTGNAPPT